MFGTPLNRKQERTMYLVLLMLTVLFLLTAGIVNLMDIKLVKMLPGCLFLASTGFYCPGCGGLHAADAFISMHPVRSFLYHPIVDYTAAVVGWYLISHTVEYASRQKFSIGMRYRDFWLYLALAIVLGNWIIRNILLKGFGIPIY